MSSELIRVAKAEIGYLEKRSNKDLDSKTANAGSGNYTKYWRDIDPSLQGSYWCDVFVDWCFVKAYGLKEAMRLECGGTKTYYTQTSAKFYKDAGRWSLTPALGAQVFFRNSKRINHTGIVVAFDDTTITAVEGNTSGGSDVIPNGGGVFQKTYKRSDPRIAGYGCPAYMEEKMTGKKIINSTGNVAQIAKKDRWKYDDSHALPPCADGKMSCDRLIFRALWDLGYKDQRQGGETVVTMDAWLVKHGFFRVTKASDLKAGDIVLFKLNGQSKPTWKWHTFLLTAYNAKTQICSKYDAGSQPRIDAGSFSKNVPLDEWDDRSFYCGYRVSGDVNRLPTSGTPYVIESAINKAYCLDIAGASMNIGANANLYKKNGTAAQQFVIQDVKNGFVRIVNKKSGLVLDVSGGKAEKGRNVQQYEWNGTKAQLWKMRMNADLSVTFESAINSNYVLDVQGGKAANKQNVQIYAWNGTKAQRWYLRK